MNRTTSATKTLANRSEGGSSSSRAGVNIERDILKAMCEQILSASQLACLGIANVNWLLHGNTRPAYVFQLGQPLADVPVNVAHSAVVQALGRLRTFHGWENNWDAEGAPAPSEAALDAASELLGFLKPYPVMPTAMLNAFGHPLLLLRYEGGEGEIEITDAEHLDFVIDGANGEVEVDTDVVFDSSGLPASLEAALRAAHTHQR